MQLNLSDENSNNNYTNNKNNTKDNDRFIVSIGTLFILLTIYLSLVNIQRKFVNCYLYATNSVLSNPLINYTGSKDMRFDRIQNLDKENDKSGLFGDDDDDYDTCNNLPIFSKAKGSKITMQSNNHHQLLADDSIAMTKYKLIRKIKLLKSTKTMDEKEEQKQKNATAEPIIYLFALTFIYLLVKAVSDLYQHYKSQIRSDANSRRYSLQTYAQYHRVERRVSSKDLPLKNSSF